MERFSSFAGIIPENVSSSRRIVDADEENEEEYEEEEENEMDMEMEREEGQNADNLAMSEEEENYDFLPTSNYFSAFSEQGEFKTENENEIQNENENENQGIYFGDDFDPLTLIHPEKNVDTLKQFRRLEYENIAEIKRKTRAMKQSMEEKKDGNESENEEEEKEANPESLFGASFEEIWETEGFGSGKRKRRTSKKKKRGRKKAKMPPEAKAKLGEANLLYAMGNYEQAAALLEEVVRIAPNEVDTYHTLGLIHETLGNQKTAFNLYMVAAHLTPDDTHLWKRLASQSMEEENHAMSIYCFSKVVKSDPSDLDAWTNKAMLLIEIQDFKGAAAALEYIHWAKKNDTEVVKLLARMLYKIGKNDRAIEVLETFIRNATDPDLTSVNILAELLMEKGCFSEASDIIEFVQKQFSCGAVYGSEEEEDFPIDLLVKCGICYGYMGDTEKAEKLFSNLKKQTVDDFCDLYVEIGDMYLAIGLCKKALKYYEVVDGSPYYDQPTIWLKIADCHVQNNDVKSSIQVYESILEELPDHSAARMKLSNFFIEKGKFERGIKVLKEMADKPLLPMSEDINDDYDDFDDAVYSKLCEHAKLKLHLSQLYLKRGRTNDFIDLFMTLLDGLLQIEKENIKKIKEFRKQLPGYKEGCLSGLLNLDILKAQKFHLFKGYQNEQTRKKSSQASRAKRRIDKLLKAREEMIKKDIQEGELNASFKNDMNEKNLELPKLKRSPIPNFFRNEETINLVFKLCDILVSKNRSSEAAWVVEGILDSVYWLKKVDRKKFTVLSLGQLSKTENENHLEEARRCILQNANDTSAWNTFHKYAPWRLGRSEKYSKFLQHVRQKHPHCVPALLISANQSSIAGYHQTALRDYLKAYKILPHDPFVSLCCGVGFINLVVGSRLSNRNQCILQAFAFFYNYASIAQDKREADYNIARAYHQLGLFYLAIPYYENVLSSFLPAKRNSNHCPAEVLEDFPSERPHCASHKTEIGDDSEVPKESTQNSKRMSPSLTFSLGLSFSDPYYSVSGDGCKELHRLAAHNLILIYKSAGAYNLARQIMVNHLQI